VTGKKFRKIPQHESFSDNILVTTDCSTDIVNMPTALKDLEKLIIQNIPRDVLMACEDAYHSGDAKGRLQAAGYSEGHRPSAAGHSKHFFINEGFHEALQVHGAEPTPLRGTRLVVGKLGIFSIARLNVPNHKWVDMSRSATRRMLAEYNLAIQRKYVQGDFFADATHPSMGTIFIVGVMDGVDANGVAQLTNVMLALPAPDMKSWLYMSTIANFVALYDEINTTTQVDKAQPVLKAKKQTGNDQGN
jgi:hypothetical protein